MVLIRVPARTTGGGGAGLTFAKVVKSVDEIVNNSTVLQDDDELFVALLANRVYGFLIFGDYSSGSVPDFKYAFSHPAGSVGDYNFQIVNGTSSRALTTITGIGGASPLDVVMAPVGRIIMGGTAGNLQLQWAQNTAVVSDTILRAGTYMIVWEEN